MTRYVIIDTSSLPCSISGLFKNLNEAEERCYEWRKKRYAQGNLVKEIEYDNIKSDMGLNVFKISEKVF